MFASVSVEGPEIWRSQQFRVGGLGFFGFRGQDSIRKAAELRGSLTGVGSVSLWTLLSTRQIRPSHLGAGSSRRRSPLRSRPAATVSWDYGV